MPPIIPCFMTPFVYLKPPWQTSREGVGTRHVHDTTWPRLEMFEVSNPNTTGFLQACAIILVLRAYESPKGLPEGRLLSLGSSCCTSHPLKLSLRVHQLRDTNTYMGVCIYICSSTLGTEMPIITAFMEEQFRCQMGCDTRHLFANLWLWWNEPHTSTTVLYITSCSCSSVSTEFNRIHTICVSTGYSIATGVSVCHNGKLLHHDASRE